MNATGIYRLRGTFEKGFPHDGIAGYLQIEAAPEGPLKGVLWFLELTIAGRSPGMLVPDRVEGLTLTRDGEVAFSIGSSWRFSGTLSEDTMAGRHSFHRGVKPPLVGRWSADLLHTGSPELRALGERLRVIGKKLNE